MRDTIGQTVYMNSILCSGVNKPQYLTLPNLMSVASDVKIFL